VRADVPKEIITNITGNVNRAIIPLLVLRLIKLYRNTAPCDKIQTINKAIIAVGRVQTPKSSKNAFPGVRSVNVYINKDPEIEINKKISKLDRYLAK
jgi:hypothetical protein